MKILKRSTDIHITAHKGSKGQLTEVNLNSNKNTIHFIGIAGTAMAGLAGVLKNKGFSVQGSDQNTYPPMSDQLKKMNIPLLEDYKANRINSSIQLVVVGNSISAQNKEAQKLLISDIPYVSLPELIQATLIKDRQSIVVSGTHGKSTTSSLLAFVTESCQKNPSFLIGAIPNNFNQSFKQTNSSWFIIEGDEYDTAFFDKRPKFIHYQPFSVILTSIEYDHVDIYDSLEKVKNSFEMLIRSLPQDGFLVVNAEDKNIESILNNASTKNIISYGVTCGQYRLENRTTHSDKGCQKFTISCPNKERFDIQFPLFGLHNAMNALGVFSLCHRLGWKADDILEGMSKFQGVRRRSQILKETPKAILIEDFAHHPTSVKSTIESLKEKYANRDVIAVFEPRSASSRRNVFQKDYTRVFSKVSKVYIVPPWREFEIAQHERFSSENLVKELQIQGIKAYLWRDVKKMANAIVQSLEKPSVIVVMSNGPFDGVHGEIARLL